ncbi:MAG: DUF86 domain-containing protein [Bacteroidetes bacterium]|nr:DUF86 domain-containing protein [Bacteroidota bacterium]
MNASLFCILLKENSKENIIQDATLCRALARSLEIIGEATKRIEDDIKIKYPHLKWQDMKNMRNRLIHDYFGTDYEIVYDTAVKDIPELHHEIKRIIEIESKK